MNRNYHKQQIFWGVFLSLSAIVLVVLTQLHFALGVWTIFATIILLIFLIQGLMQRLMPVAVFAVALLAMLYAKPLGITALVPWTILGAAVLLSIGLSLLIRPKWNHWQHTGDITYYSGDDDNLAVVANMSNTIRYLTSADFTGVNVVAHMAGVKVYFDKVNLATETAVINVDSSLSNVELYVPRDWEIVPEIALSMSGVEEIGGTIKSGPQVTLVGRASLSGIKIIYM